MPRLVMPAIADSFASKSKVIVGYGQYRNAVASGRT